MSERTMSMHSGCVMRLSSIVFAWCLLCTQGALAQTPEWRPSKSLEVIAGAGPASSFDRTARAIQRALQERKLVDQPVSVINRVGGGGALAWNYLNTHQGDGHYLAVIVPGVLTNRITGSNPLSYKDLTPIAMLYSEYVIVAVSTASTIKSGGELIGILRKDPGALSIGVATALGGANHLALALALKNAGVDTKRVRFVVFPSAPESVTAVSGKHVDVVSASPGNILPQMTSGLIRSLAITSPSRLEGQLAEIPTWKEQGVDAVFGSWRGVVGPKGMTTEQIAYWDGIFKKVVGLEQWKLEAEKNRLVDSYMNSKETAAYLDQQNVELTSLLSSLGLAK